VLTFDDGPVPRVEANRGGIVLFHDTRAQTAAMLAGFLCALKNRGYRVVHVVAAAKR
jgi:peptidoglycan/xylan/chitin deacetylase (PgdA/CDA1 family)